jgi:uncharacterized protein (TIGR00661 family)
MKIMLSVLGEGRGHMTQAIAVKDLLENAGHNVVATVLGMGSRREPPEFFALAMKMPITRVPSLDFSVKNERTVRLPATIAGVIRNLPAYWRGLRKLKAIVRETQPDVLINFFEPLTGIYALTCRRRPPVVAVAHQFMHLHPDYVRAPGLALQQFGLRCFVRLVGAGSTRLALSLYETRDLPQKRLTVCPPLLRRQLFDLRPNEAGDFVLVYLLNHGYAGQILEWHQRNPHVRLHCFYDKPGAPAEEQHDATLTFHRLDGEKFLRMMAQCKYVVSTAGFESVCEAAWLGKPLFLVPVENHIEQQINAIDARRFGLGVMDSSFKLDRLAELPPRLETANFRVWLGRAESLVLRTLENAVHGENHEDANVLHLEPEAS